MKNAPRFALIGAAGFVAPRHMEAIAAVGGELVAALDPHDSVGVLDKYFPRCEFFTEAERFERHLHKYNNSIEQIHYLAVCSPNYLHGAHVRLGLYAGCDVICEKPLVLNPDNLDLINEAQEDSGGAVYPVLQLRLHPAIEALRSWIEPEHPDYQVALDYQTPRGRWYNASWKGDEEKSGGVITNIGIHMFDLLIDLFGDPLYAAINSRTSDTVEGALWLQGAEVSWRLSIAPGEPRRVLRVGTREPAESRDIDLSTGFETAHNEVYRQIMNGVGPTNAAAAIELCWLLRKLPATGERVAVG